jgi:hypothetical protein
MYAGTFSLDTLGYQMVVIALGAGSRGLGIEFQRCCILGGFGALILRIIGAALGQFIAFLDEWYCIY